LEEYVMVPKNVWNEIVKKVEKLEKLLAKL